MEHLETAISNQGLGQKGNFIDSFDGSGLYKFKDWVRTQDKYAVLNNLDDTGKNKIRINDKQGSR